MPESDEKKIKTLMEMVGDYPAKDLPLIFADSVPIVSWRGGVVKFYFMRVDPSISANLTDSAQLVAQAVMPIFGFAATAVFFEEQLKTMIDGGLLTTAAVEDMRASYRRRQTEKDAAKR